jgi:hypothetical protein
VDEEEERYDGRRHRPACPWIDAVQAYEERDCRADRRAGWVFGALMAALAVAAAANAASARSAR